MTDAALAGVVAAALAVLFIIVGLVRRAVSPVVVSSAPDPHHLNRIDERMKDLEGDLKTTKHDVSNIKMIVNNLPNKDATHRMELELNTVAGQVNALKAELAANSRSCERIEQILMGRDSK